MKEYIVSATIFRILVKRCKPFECRGCGQAFEVGDRIVSLIRVKGQTKHYHSFCYERTQN